eukprot:s2273_g9.t1
MPSLGRYTPSMTADLPFDTLLAALALKPSGASMSIDALRFVGIRCASECDDFRFIGPWSALSVTSRSRSCCHCLIAHDLPFPKKVSFPSIN